MSRYHPYRRLHRCRPGPTRLVPTQQALESAGRRHGEATGTREGAAAPCHQAAEEEARISSSSRTVLGLSTGE